MADILKIENGVLIACTDKSVTSVVIPEGVRRIGRIAFLDCSSLVSVEIPEGVRYIAERAFNRCSSLESVVLPSSVTEIGEYAFRTCKSLKSVVIKSSATKICEGAFEYCESITSVEFSGTVAQWKEVEGKEVNLLHYIPAMSVKCSDGEWQKPVIFVKDGIAVKCLYNKATSVEIPDGVTAIGKYAFTGCKSLSSVVIPPRVTKIGEGAFTGCESLSAVEIPPSVTKIGKFTFSDCKSLKSVVLPSSVTEIGDYAFSGCKSLSTVTLGDDFEKVPSEWFDSLNEANVNYEIICTEGSRTYKAIKRSARLKAHVKTLALQNAKNKKIAQVNKAGADAVLSSLLAGKADSSFEILSNTKSSTVAMLQIGKNIGVFKLGADSSKWLPKVKKVIEAFSDLSKSGADIFAVIQELKLPLAEIPVKKAKLLMLKADVNGFMNLFAAGALRAKKYDGVKNLALFGVTKIDDRAFYDCASLSSLKIPNSVTQIGLYAFHGCKSLSTVILPSAITKIIDDMFAFCTSLSSIEIPDGVTEIGFSAFKNCTSLSSVKIPDSVTQIKERAFEHCNISELDHRCISIKNGCAIKDGKLSYLASQSPSITVPDGVNEIGSTAFHNCAALSSVKIAEGVTQIDNCAFNGCEALTSVFIPKSVRKIGVYAFEYCTSLSSIDFGGTVAEWGCVEKESWTKNSSIKSVKCTDGEVGAE